MHTRPIPSLRRVTAAASAALLVGAASVMPMSSAGAVGDGVSAPDAVSTWNAHAADTALACLVQVGDPLHEVRMYAMVHIAVHDALNAIDRRYETYAFDGHAPGAAPEAAVAAAAHAVLRSELPHVPGIFEGCVPAALEVAESAYAEELAKIPDGPAKAQGIAVGEAAAAAIIALRADDGWDTEPLADYPEPQRPGEYGYTDISTPFFFLRGWKDLELFALRDASQFRPGRPYSLRSPRYVRDFEEIKRLGGDGVTTPSARTPEQTEIALYWLESSPLQWNRIGRELARSQGLDLWEAARLFGLLDIALSDAYVASWHTKDHYGFWRPISAIHLADQDGNPRTQGDRTWTPLRLTPPIPDYDSGHSVEGGAAAAVFRSFFGTDRISFSTCSYTLTTAQPQDPPAEDVSCTGAEPTLRHFTSFSQAAEENAESRVLIGFHFRTSTEVGVRHGMRIGDRIADRYLEPVGHHRDR